MAILEKSKLFASPKMNSRIKSANVQTSERWLGYFTGPDNVKDDYKEFLKKAAG